MLNLLNNLFEIDKSFLKLIKIGLIISFSICLVAIIFVTLYNKYYISHDLYEASIILLKTGLIYAVQFIVCGIATNKIQKTME